MAAWPADGDSPGGPIGGLEWGGVTMATGGNPYEAPRQMGLVTGVKSGRVEDLRAVAFYQRGILLAILTQIVCYGLMVAFGGVGGQSAPGAAPNLTALVPALLVLAAGLAGVVFMFLLAMKVYSTGVGVLLGVLGLIPCVGLLVLLIVSGKATTILKENGYKVGLLGAKMSQFPAAG